MKRWATIPIVFLVAFLLAPATVFGQGATTGSVQGQVVDSNGEPLPGANVVAVHVPSGTQYGASTNESGRYTLANLRVGGPYQVTVSFVGYQSKREEDVTLDLGQTLRLNFTLEEKTAEMQEIQVIGKTTGILSSEREGVATNISTEQIESQPTMGRKIADIARLVPQSYVVNSDDDGAAISIGQQNTDFNSIYIDGAVSNDVFGLSAQGTDGGQSGAAPISLSAVEQVSVDVSPFSVTKSGFTGGAINFVTKSGTNDFEGSFEYFRRSSNLTQQTLDFRGNEVVDGLPSAPDNRFVGTLGGPIIEDELFFFVNVDIRRSEDALPFQRPYLGQTLGSGGSDDPNQLDQLDEVQEFMIRNTGYDPGVPGDKATTLDANKFLFRLDYNLADNHKLTTRYFYNDHSNRDRFQSTQRFVNFSNDSEVFPHTQHNAMLQWNGSFENGVATKTTATFKNVTDDRGVQGEPFPSITVEDGPEAEFRLGSEAFSRPNYLEQTVATLSNRTDFFVGDHTLTVGTHNEFYSIDNRFAVFGPGVYEFGSVSEFAETVCHYAYTNQGDFGIDQPGQICQTQYPNGAGFGSGQASPQSFYLRQYSLLDDDPDTAEFESLANDNTNLRSDFNAVKLGFYAQDQWEVSDRFRLTFGLRADIPKILDDPGMAPDANSATLYGTNLAASDFDGPSVSSFYDLNGAQAGEMPDWRAFWSPRAGFNYALDEERTTQIRGGTGVYTSRLPFVWPGGAFLNDGVSSDFLVGVGLELRRPENALTRPEPGCCGGFFGGGGFGGGGVPVDEITPTGNLFVFQEDFSYPRVWRTSLAIDRQLPFNLVGTLEGQYTNQLQDIVTRNVNLKQPNANLDGPDSRPIYQAGQYPDGSLTIDSRYGDIFLLENTTRGYSYELTARLEKQATPVWGGGLVRGQVSYTYGDARSLNTYGGDTVGSLWDGNEHVNGTNNLTLGRSEFSLGHQVQASIVYRQEITRNVSTNLSLYYSGSSGRPFSYTIGSSLADGAATAMIGDEGGQPLFYVPQSVSQLTLEPITDDDGNVLRSVAEQRTDLARFIENVDNLNNNRDGYAVRNGDRTPFEGVVDLNFSVDFTGDFVGRTQRLTVNANIFNFSSLLGDLFGTDWGYRYATQGSYNVVEFAGFQDPDGDGNPTPVYQSGLGFTEGQIVRDKEDIFDLRTTGTTYSSLYQFQLGLKYTF